MSECAVQHGGPEHGDAQHGGPEHGDAQHGHTKVSLSCWGDRDMDLRLLLWDALMDELGRKPGPGWMWECAVQHGGPEHGDAQHGHTKVSHLAWGNRDTGCFWML